MGLPVITLGPSAPTLTFPGVNTESKKQSPAEEKVEPTAKLESQPQQPFAKEPAKKVEARRAPDSNQFLQELDLPNTELSISLDKDTKQIVVKVVNAKTGEVIRQIPPEELLHLAERLKEFGKGLINEVA